MASSYYDPGEDRARKVNALFAAIASRYDRINDIQSFGMHHKWKRRLVAMAGLESGDRALDVCCGTGDIAEILAATGAEVTGLDFTEEMLAVARQRDPKIKYLQGDAMSLPFKEAEFDVVTVGFGLRNLADWRKGLDEMHRVVKPGGRLLVLDFGRPDNALWRTFYFAYLRMIVPVYGKLFCGNWAAYAYILESLKNYPAQRGVESAMHDLRCEDTRVINFFGGAMSINFGIRTA